MKSRQHRAARFVRVQCHVVADTICGKQAVHSTRLKQLPFDNFREQLLRIGEELACLLSVLFVPQNRRVPPTQFPGVEKRRPIDKWDNIFKRNLKALDRALLRVWKPSRPRRDKRARTDKLRLRQIVVLQFRRAGASLFNADQLQFFPGMLGAEPLVLRSDLSHETGFSFRAYETADNRNGAACVQYMNDGMLVAWRNLHRRVGLARSGPANQQRQIKTLALHLAGNVRHFIEGRRNQSAEADHVHFVLAGDLENFLARHHYTEINHLIVIAAKNDADDIFPDVMDITLDCCQEHFSLRPQAATGFFLGFHKWREIGHGLFHHTRALHHLRQKHFPRAK